MGYSIKLIWNVALALLIGGQLHAQPPGSNPITVEHPWARATPGGATTGAAYMTLTNGGDTADQLLGATTPVADKVQFHKQTEENGVERMRELRTVEIPSKGKVTFKPGDMHIMMIGLKQPLNEGHSFPLTLTIEKAGKTEVVVSVAKIGAMQGEDVSPMMNGTDHMMK